MQPDSAPMQAGSGGGSPTLAATGTHASVVDLTFAIWLATITLGFSRSLLNGDGDPARHIMIGRHIWTHGPRFADPFSFTRAGEPFLAYEWLSQAAYAAAHAIGGLPAVALLAGALIATALTLVVAYVRRQGGDAWLAFLTGAVAAVLTFPHWLARPHLFTYVATAALLHLLCVRVRTGWLLLLFALWANLHPGFLYGLILTAAWLAGQALDDVRAGHGVRTAMQRLRPLAACAAASLLTPFGWNLHAHAFQWLQSDTVKLVDEFLPLVLPSAYGLIFLGVMGALVAGFAASRRWVGWPVLLVCWTAFIAGLLARRNAPLFALFALPVATRSLTPLLARMPDGILRRMRVEFARADRPGWRIGAVTTAVLVLLLALDLRVPQVNIVPTSFSAEVFPASAIRAARESGVQGRLLSKYEWGGYVLHAWPGQRLFIDSMADFFGDDLIGKYSIMARAAAGWRATMHEYDIALVLFPPDVPLVAELRRSPDWRVLHEDEVAVLLARSDVASGRP